MHERTGSSEATRRMVMVIWCVFLAGALGLTVVAAIVGPGIWPHVSSAGAVLAWVILGMAVVCFVASTVLPARIEPTPGATAGTLAVGRSVAATALNGSVALFAPLGWMVSGKVIALVALALSLVGLLMVMPSQQRWDALCRAITATFGRELVASAQAPPTRRSRPLVASMLALAVLGAVALVLAGSEFWTTEVLRRPVSKVARVLTVLDLALMMIVLAVLRVARGTASTSWRRRFHAVLLLVFAGCLLVLAMRMV